MQSPNLKDSLLGLVQKYPDIAVRFAPDFLEAFNPYAKTNDKAKAAIVIVNMLRAIMHEGDAVEVAKVVTPVVKSLKTKGLI